MTLQYRRLSNGASELNITPLHLRDDFQTPQPYDICYVLLDGFTTFNGSWEVTNDHYSITQWARDRYLLPWGHECMFDDAGGDHHVFGASLPQSYTGGNVGCQLQKGAGMFFQNHNNQPEQKQTKENSGWANVPMFSGDLWRWAKYGPTDLISGAHMPGNHHVSWFAVWVGMPWTTYQETFLGTQPPIIPPPITPPIEPPTQPLPPLEGLEVDTVTITYRKK